MCVVGNFRKGDIIHYEIQWGHEFSVGNSPTGVTVHHTIDLRRMPRVCLPEGLHVVGDLDVSLSGCSIIPDGLVVRGLNISNTRISVVPSDTIVTYGYFLVGGYKSHGPTLRYAGELYTIGNGGPFLVYTR